ncbi:MAG TPA: LysE family transporter [Spirochaetota bacterium]|mgnify:CR=1 FL=1|nr:LysE family transporter [Spirochaetota bacterium]
METLVLIFFTSFGVAFSGALMPGPLLTVTISESTKRGMSAGPLLVAGHAVLEMALIVALVFGLAPVFKIDLFFISVAFAGGLAMIIMATGMFRSLSTLTVNNVNDINKSDTPASGNLIFKGIIMSLANPYWTIWWATIGIGMIILSKNLGLAGVVTFFLGHILGDLVWYAAVSIAISKGRRLFTDKMYRGIIATCAVYLTGFAVFLIFSGIRKLI